MWNLERVLPLPGVLILKFMYRGRFFCVCNDRVIDTLQSLSNCCAMGSAQSTCPRLPGVTEPARVRGSPGAAALGISKALPAVGHAPVRVQH